MRSTETLLARKHSHRERQERIITDALADRWPAPERQQALRLVAMVGIGTLPLAIEIWSSLERCGPPADHLDEAFAAVRSESLPRGFPRGVGTICYAAAVSVTDRCSKAIGLM